MRNDFKPVHLKKVKKQLSMQLKEVEAVLNKEKEHYTEMYRKHSLIYRFFSIFKK